MAALLRLCCGVAEPFALQPRDRMLKVTKEGVGKSRVSVATSFSCGKGGGRRGGGGNEVQHRTLGALPIGKSRASCVRKHNSRKKKN